MSLLIEWCVHLCYCHNSASGSSKPSGSFIHVKVKTTAKSNEDGASTNEENRVVSGGNTKVNSTTDVTATNDVGEVGSDSTIRSTTTGGQASLTSTGMAATDDGAVPNEVASSKITADVSDSAESSIQTGLAAVRLLDNDARRSTVGGAMGVNIDSGTGSSFRTEQEGAGVATRFGSAARVNGDFSGRAGSRIKVMGSSVFGTNGGPLDNPQNIGSSNFDLNIDVEDQK